MRAGPRLSMPKLTGCEEQLHDQIKEEIGEGAMTPSGQSWLWRQACPLSGLPQQQTP